MYTCTCLYGLHLYVHMSVTRVHLYMYVYRCRNMFRFYTSTLLHFTSCNSHVVLPGTCAQHVLNMRRAREVGVCMLPRLQASSGAPQSTATGPPPGVARGPGHRVPWPTFLSPPSTRALLRLRPHLVSLLGHVLLMSHSPSPSLVQPAAARPCCRLITAHHRQRVQQYSPVPRSLQPRPPLRTPLNPWPLRANYASGLAAKASATRNGPRGETSDALATQAQVPQCWPLLWAQATRLPSWSSRGFVDRKRADGGLVRVLTYRTHRRVTLAQFFAILGHSHPVLRHLVVGPQQNMEPPLGLAVVILFLVKLPLAVA